MDDPEIGVADIKVRPIDMSHITGSDMSRMTVPELGHRHMVGSDMGHHMTSSEMTHMAGSEMSHHMTGSNMAHHNMAESDMSQMAGSEIAQLTASEISQITGGEKTGEKDKSRRKSLSLKEKLDIIEEIEKGEKTQAQIATDRNLSKSTVYSIWTIRNKIKSANSIHGRQVGCKRLRMPMYEEVDQALYRWVLYAREKGETTFSVALLTEKASKFAASLGMENFKCTNSWIDRFKSRHGIRLMTSKNASADGAEGKYSWFVNELPNLLSGSCSFDIYTVNEIGLFYQVLPQENQVMGGSDTNIANNQKVTLLLGANMDGSDRLPPLVIGSSTVLSNLENTDALSVSYCQDPNSWMTAQIWANWIHLFDRKMYTMRRKVILFIDACPSHFLVNHLRAVSVHFVPPACQHIMPIKQGVMQRFKAWYRKLVLRDMVDSMEDGLVSQIDMLSTMYFVRKAWEHITQDCIINAFKLAGWEHDDFQSMDCCSQRAPSISQECFQLNISESIFEHMNQEEERMITREELTDKVILESVTSQSGASNSLYNANNKIEEEPVYNTRSTSADANAAANARMASSETVTDSTNEPPPGLEEAKAAISTLKSYVTAIENEKNASKLREEETARLKAKRNRKKKAKMMSLCPEKGVFEIQEMKVDHE